MPTRSQAIRDATATLQTVPELRPNAARDAEWLLLHLLGLTRADLRAHPERELTAPDHFHYEARVARRLRQEPVQYITGEQEFYGLRLRVTPAVLIPRPETERLVEAVLAEVPHDQPARIVDVGTGSGAIAIALAAHLPLARLTAVDISSKALQVAKENARTHSLQHRIRFLETDLLSAFSDGDFDVVVSNPPYVSDLDQSSLAREVCDYEPEAALFAGATGLDIYRRLIPQAAATLAPGGLLAMELGFGQHDALARLLEGWSKVAFLQDLQQIPRVVLARRLVKSPDVSC